MKQLSFVIVCCICLHSGRAEGDVVYSTFGPVNAYDSFNGVNISGPATAFPQGFAEQFMPTKTAYLDDVSVAMSTQIGTSELSMRVYGDNAGVPGPLLETIQVSNFMSGIVTAGFGGNMLLDAGRNYWLGLFTSNGNQQIWHDTTAVGSGLQSFSSNGGATWTTFPSNPFPRAAFQINGTNVTSDVSLIAPASAWRYFPGLGEPSPALEWTTATYNDTAWNFDVEGFGYDADPLTRANLLSHVAKPLTDMRDDGNNPNPYSVLYLRRSFSVADPTALANLVLGLDYDDSFIAYINGVEVARSDFGTAGIPEPFDGLGVSHESTNGNPSIPLERFVIDLIDDFPGLLHAGGGNVLAIQGLNESLDSDDFVLSQIGLGGSFLTLSVEGDFNGNGSVDAADYVIWRHTLGHIGASLAADANNDGKVDSNDYAVWRANFGQSTGSGTALPSAKPLSVAVPEPAFQTFVFILTGLLAICCRPRSQQL